MIGLGPPSPALCASLVMAADLRSPFLALQVPRAPFCHLHVFLSGLLVLSDVLLQSFLFHFWFDLF